MWKEQILSGIGEDPDKPNIFIKNNVRNHSYQQFWRRSELTESGLTEVYCNCLHEGCLLWTWSVLNSCVINRSVLKGNPDIHNFHNKKIATFYTFFHVDSTRGCNWFGCFIFYLVWLKACCYTVFVSRVFTIDESLTLSSLLYSLSSCIV